MTKEKKGVKSHTGKGKVAKKKRTWKKPTVITIRRSSGKREK